MIISPERWGKIKVSKHHYALTLAKRGNVVYYLNPPSISGPFSINVKNVRQNLKIINYRTFLRGSNRFPMVIRRYIHGRVHRLRDPVIKKVEVIKEVPKEVEKTVFKDKVVYVDKEIPVKGDEIIKHHYVYVPFPTDDEELLKKGPFSAPNYEKKDDKDKKK